MFVSASCARLRVHLYCIRVRLFVVCETESAPLWYVFVYVSCARMRVHLYGTCSFICRVRVYARRDVLAMCRVYECARNIVSN